MLYGPSCKRALSSSSNICLETLALRINFVDRLFDNLQKRRQSQLTQDETSIVDNLLWLPFKGSASLSVNISKARTWASLDQSHALDNVIQEQ